MGLLPIGSKRQAGVWLLVIDLLDVTTARKIVRVEHKPMTHYSSMWLGYSKPDFLRDT
jgi:hypothetical protein